MFTCYGFPVVTLHPATEVSYVLICSYLESFAQFDRKYDRKPRLFEKRPGFAKEIFTNRDYERLDWHLPRLGHECETHSERPQPCSVRTCSLRKHQQIATPPNTLATSFDESNPRGIIDITCE